VIAPASPPPIALLHLLNHCADMVQGVQDGRSLTDLLAQVPAAAHAATQALAFQVMRRLGGAQAVRSAVAPKRPPPAVDALLVSAIALLWPAAAGDRPAYPDHTLVDQAVRAAHLRVPAAAAFVNAVLRRFVRERVALVAAAQTQPVGAFNHPLWWIERLKHDWPTHWQALLHEANRRPPMTLRVNARRGDAAAYVQRLAAQGQTAQATGRHAVTLGVPCPVSQLPGFAQGDVSVQDAAAQRAAPLLLGVAEPGAVIGDGRLPPRARVLDACAAPGGKTAHLLELAELDLLALDSDPHRLARVQDNLQRLHLSATLKVGDARSPAGWWDGRLFDAILIDAPCSGSGVVRRHPDIRWLRRPGDIAALAGTQAAMLDALWPLLAPGGRLVYATCSVFRAEGGQQIDAFLQRLGPAAACHDPASPGHLLPLPDNASPGTVTADGFFYALIHKP
jgi:16S rRNA (cytosine967-C5)-methyltransferase